MRPKKERRRRFWGVFGDNGARRYRRRSRGPTPSLIGDHLFPSTVYCAPVPSLAAGGLPLAYVDRIAAWREWFKRV